MKVKKMTYPLSIWNVATAAMTKPSLIKRLHILYPPFSSISWYYFMSEYATCYYNRWGLWVWDRARPSEKTIWSHEVTFVTDKILFLMITASSHILKIIQSKHLLTVTYEAFCDFQYCSDETRLFANFDILIQEKV